MSSNEVEWSCNTFPKWVQDNSILNLSATCWNCHKDFQASLVVGGHYDENNQFQNKFCQDGIHYSEEKDDTIECRNPMKDRDGRTMVSVYDSSLTDGAHYKKDDNIILFTPHLADAPYLLKHYFNQNIKHDDTSCPKSKDQWMRITSENKEKHPFKYCSEINLKHNGRFKNIVACSKKNLNDSLDADKMNALKEKIDGNNTQDLCTSKSEMADCHNEIKKIHSYVRLTECPTYQAVEMQGWRRELVYTSDGKLRCNIIDKKTGKKMSWKEKKKTIEDKYKKLVKEGNCDEATHLIDHFESLQHLKHGHHCSPAHRLPGKIKSK